MVLWFLWFCFSLCSDVIVYIIFLIYNICRYVHDYNSFCFVFSFREFDGYVTDVDDLYFCFCLFTRLIVRIIMLIIIVITGCWSVFKPYIFLRWSIVLTRVLWCGKWLYSNCCCCWESLMYMSGRRLCFAFSPSILQKSKQSRECARVLFYSFPRRRWGRLPFDDDFFGCIFFVVKIYYLYLRTSTTSIMSCVAFLMSDWVIYWLMSFR